MEFINHPKKLNSFRTDCCTYLKNDDGDCISLKITKNNFSNLRLKVKLTLEDDKDKSHFFKLCLLNRKNRKTKELINGEIEFDVPLNEEEIKLDFFGIRKTKKEEAMKFISENISKINVEDILKKNSSSVILILFLINDLEEICQLPYKLNIGKSEKDEIKIKAYTPKVLCDNNGEITFKLESNINNREPTNSLFLMIENEEKNYENKIRPSFYPAKSVVVFLIKIDEKIGDRFFGRLVYENNFSDWCQFSLRKNITELLKRKSSYPEESCPDSKISRYSLIPISESCSVNANIVNSKKSVLNDILTTKVLREIARVGHDFAFGRMVTDRMKHIMEKLPVVCILQDDVGDTPLNNAILQNQEERANYLLDIICRYFPKEINTRNTSNHTALILSPACDVSLCFIGKLIDSGSDLRAVDCDGNSALNVAITYKKLDVLNFLLSTGISQNIFEHSDILLLLTSILNLSYFDGFCILSDHFPWILEFETFFDSHSNIYTTYKDFLNKKNVNISNVRNINISEDITNYEINNETEEENENSEFFTPVEENNINIIRNEIDDFDLNELLK